MARKVKHKLRAPVRDAKIREAPTAPKARFGHDLNLISAITAHSRSITKNLDGSAKGLPT